MDLTNPQVTDKYREAAKAANMALNAILSTQLKAGAAVVDICEFGDAIVEEQCRKVFKAAGIEKGLAFPTCVSVNECAGHYSPLRSESTVLKAGDLVKVDVGVHMDNFIAVVAGTGVVAGEGGAVAVTGKRADLLTAAYAAAEAALRTIKPGAKNSDVTRVVGEVAEAYGVTPLAGVLMHEMKQAIIDGHNVILLRGDDADARVEEVTFEPFQVWSIDVMMSTGEGKPRETGTRTTVYKLALDATYAPKLKASRYVVSEVTRKSPYMPFTVRSLGSDAGEARKVSEALLGVADCAKHGVIHPYPVLYEKAGCDVAHVKFTALLLPGGTLKVAGNSLPDYVRSDKSLPEPLAALLLTEPYVSKSKKKDAGAAAAGGAAGKA